MKEFFIDKELAIRLKEVRSMERLSQVEMAEKLGINRMTYTNYELGTRRISEKLPKKLNKVFGVSEVWFYTGIGKMKFNDKAPALTTDIREMKEMITTLTARVKYLENLYMSTLTRLNDKPKL